MLRRSVGSVAVALALAAAAATAATDTDTLTVTATVQSGCALTGGTLNFGPYVSGQSQDLDAVGQITFASCTGQLRFELDGGVGGGGSIPNRQMSFGSNKLRYQIYRNSSRANVWGAGTDAYVTTLLQVQNGKVDVYGRIPGGQVVAPGTYSDTIGITLTF